MRALELPSIGIVGNKNARVLLMIKFTQRVLVALTFLIYFSSNTAAVEKNTITMESKDFQGFLTSIDNKIENQELKNENTFYLAFGSLLISLLMTIIFYLMGSNITARKTHIQTREEGKKIRKKLKHGFSSVGDSQKEIELASKSIKDKTKKLHNAVKSISTRVNSLSLEKGSPLIQELQKESLEYEKLLNSLESENSTISKALQDSKSYVRELEKILNKNNTIVSTLSHISLAQDKAKNDLEKIKGYIEFNQNLLQELSNETISKNELVQLLNSSIDELVITRNRYNGE